MQYACKVINAYPFKVIQDFVKENNFDLEVFEHKKNIWALGVVTLKISGQNNELPDEQSAPVEEKKSKKVNSKPVKKPVKKVKK